MNRVAVLRIRPSPGGFDADGDPVSSTSPEATITGCLWAPGDTSEPRERGQHGVVVAGDLLAPAGTDIKAGDQIRLPGDPDAFNVEGQPERWNGERVGGVLAKLRRVVG